MCCHSLVSGFHTGFYETVNYKAKYSCSGGEGGKQSTPALGGRGGAKYSCSGGEGLRACPPENFGCSIMFIQVSFGSYETLVFKTTAC